MFGHFCDLSATDDYGKYLQSIHNPYWIVWDEEKKKLIRWQDMVPDTNLIIPQVLIVDSEQNNWNVDEDGIGCVDFLSRELLDSFLDLENQPEEILEICRAMDADYEYNDTPEIKTQKDIDDLMLAACGFHDAYIAKEELQEDGTLYLRFDDVWGCKIEMWLRGDLEYDTSSRSSDKNDPYWFGSTIILQDGFIYFIDDDDIRVEEIGPEYCYFKSRHMKYRILPD